MGVSYFPMENMISSVYKIHLKKRISRNEGGANGNAVCPKFLYKQYVLCMGGSKNAQEMG